MRPPAATGTPWRLVDATFHTRMIEIAGNGTLVRVWR